MMGLLQHAGATITADAESADVLVVNTCSFIDKAKQESVDTILEMARLKTDGQAKRLVVAGCMVERYREEIQKNIPEVDAVIGTGELESILAAAGMMPTPTIASPFRILTAAETTHVRPSRAEGNAREAQGRFSRENWDGAIASLPNYLYDETTPRLRTTQRSSAYIKIAEGCDHPCGFCIIPQLRGKFRSRRFESVIAEAQRLVAEGVQEITLIGQDTTCYGEDLGMTDGLAELLDALAQIKDENGGLRWIRFLYAYPNKVTPRLLETMARHDNICKYLDVPLQHASPAVLKRMKRGGGADIFLKMLERARAAMPEIALRTSFIAGFPGETEADFSIMLDFVKEVRFDWLGVFQYSDEEGSAAYALDGKVAKRSITARQNRLMREQQKISRKAKAMLVERTMDVLVEGESEETPLLWQGRSERHAPEIDGTVYVNDFGPYETLEPGRFYRCEVTEAHDYDVVARVVA
jgi:ribosomal protein S12 methylthiotransferase